MPGAVRHTGPELGRDTRAVLTELVGLSGDQVSDLVARGLLREPS
jgi:crotonobetainyl-CoA:carnitine CoA-transferase CaiB-like acyl-CoA transferase